jgi:hypothetical protein
MWAGDTYLGVFSQDAPVMVLGIPENDGGILLTICQAENDDCCAVHEFQGLNCENVGDLQNLTVLISECDEGTFMASLTFVYENVTDSFVVAGNGNTYGTFAYAALPVTVGPLPGDNETQYEFVVRDQAHPLWSDHAEVGIIDCITGVFDVARSTPLSIYYGVNGAYFVVPPGSNEYSVWTYDGKLVRSEENLSAGERVFITKHLPMPGLYFVQVNSVQHTYVGKVVGF